MCDTECILSSKKPGLYTGSKVVRRPSRPVSGGRDPRATFPAGLRRIWRFPLKSKPTNKTKLRTYFGSFNLAFAPRIPKQEGDAFPLLCPPMLTEEEHAILASMIGHAMLHGCYRIEAGKDKARILLTPWTEESRWTPKGDGFALASLVETGIVKRSKYGWAPEECVLEWYTEAVNLEAK